MSDLVRLEVQNQVALVTLDRPEAFNALDLATARDLSEVLLDLSSDSEIRALVVTGAGRAFCAGGDLRRALAHPHGPPAAFRELATFVHVCVAEIRRTPKPVIAALNGVAAGGGFSLALACDFRIMAASARLVQGYTSQGLAIDAGGSFTLPRLVGLARALEIAAFDEPIPADRALAWGLVTRVVPDGAVVEEARAMAATLAQRSIHAFASVKRLLTDSFDTSLEGQLEREREALLSCAGHPDGLEGIRAFLEKRRPVYERRRAAIPP
ncbi:MAG TPA: enoyl-CoA hydratase-related protein [Longimicrobiaceae bacterium]|nr:enoyl-CoA hydratase-related protein [Longimicrobiaceae bacterium]